MNQQKFIVLFLLNVEEENNMLSFFEEHHLEDVHDLITNVMYDVDDV